MKKIAKTYLETLCEELHMLKKLANMPMFLWGYVWKPSYEFFFSKKLAYKLRVHMSKHGSWINILEELFLKSVRIIKSS